MQPAPDDLSLQDQIASLHPRLLRFALALTGDREEAADLAQDTVARAIGASWRFTPGTNLVAWLFQIARNLHRNRMRDQRTRPRVASLDDLRDDSDFADTSFSPVERSVIERADLADVRRAFEELPQRYMLPILLTTVEGLAYAEAAEILGLPVGTVMSRIHRGRRLLMARIGETRS